MNPNHGIRSDETGATKGPPQQHGSVSRSKDSHATRLLNYLTKNLTPQRSPGQNPTTSTLGNDGAGWRPLDGPNSLLMAPLRTTLGKTLAKHVSRPPPEPQPPPWPPPLKPWPPWPAINLSAAPRFSTLPAEVDSGCPLLQPPGFPEAIKDALAFTLPSTTIPPKKATNGTTKSCPTTMGRATKTRPHHQFHSTNDFVIPMSEMRACGLWPVTFCIQDLAQPNWESATASLPSPPCDISDHLSYLCQYSSGKTFCSGDQDLPTPSQ